jgi:hypothetical protein
MNSYIILVPAATELGDFLPSLEVRWNDVRMIGERIAVVSDNHRLYLYFDDTFRDLVSQPEMCDERLANEFSKHPNSRFLFVDYADQELAKAVISTIASKREYFIDDGDGNAARGDEFFK